MDLTTSLNNPAERRKQVRLKVRPDLHVFAQKYAVSGAQPAEQLARAIRQVSAEVNAQAAE